jgi:hypothetical protein
MNNQETNKFMRANIFISKYLLYALPLIIITIAWALFLPGQGAGANFTGLVDVLWDIAGWHFVVWFLFLIYFILALLFSVPFRERTLTILTFSKDNDERESFISGKASKATFYSTLSIMILLFFLSGLNINIHKKAKDEVPEGKNRGSITIGYEFNFLKTEKSVELVKGTMVKYSGIPFTQESIILFLILFHISSYHIFTRKRSLE